MKHAVKSGIRIALEPLHPMMTSLRSVPDNLAEANDWCDQINAEGVLGITVDTYAAWSDPRLDQQIARAGKRIFGFHVSDWLADTRDFGVDRAMMGDGIIDLAAIRAAGDATGCDGYYEVEILSARDRWQHPPAQIVGTIKQRCQSACESSELKIPYL